MIEKMQENKVKDHYPNGFFFITFFDTKENVRLTYMNGSAFPSLEEAESEFVKIRKHIKNNERSLHFTTRTKFAIEHRVEGGKRKLIKRLTL
jgi:hypothetical protein